MSRPEKDAPPPRHERKPLRLVAAVVAVVLAFILGLALLGLHYAPVIAGWALERHFAALTDRPVTLRVDRLDRDGASIADLAIGDDLRLQRAELAWTLPQLLQGRIERLTLSGAVAQGRLDGGGLSLGPLDALLAPGAGGPDFAETRLDDAMLHLAGPWGVTAVPLRAVQTPQGTLAVAELAGARLEVSADAEAAAGQLWLQAPWGHGLLDFAWTDTAIELAAVGPARLVLEQMPAWLLAAAPEVLRPALVAPLHLSLDGIGAAPARLRLGLGADGVDRLDGALRLVADGAALAGSLEVDGTAHLHPGKPARLEMRRLRAEADGLALADGRVAGVLRIDDFAGNARQGEGLARLHLIGHDLALPGLAARQASLSANGRLRFAEGMAALVLDEAGAVRLDGLRLGETVATRGPVALSLGAGATATLDLDREPGGFGLAPDLPLHGSLPLDIGGTAVDVVLHDAHLQGIWTLPDGPYLPVLAIGEAELGSADLGLVARRVGGVYALEADGPSGNFEIGELRRIADGRAGLALRGTADLHAAGEHIGFTAALAGDGGNVRVSLDGRHDPQTGRGSMTVALPAARFGPGLRPADLFPGLAGALGEAAGSIAVDGTLAWGPGGTRPDLRVAIRDYAGAVGGVAVGGLATTLRLTGLAPLATPGGQTLRVALVDAGLPLLDGEMVYALDRGRLAVAGATTHLAGGTVRLGRTLVDFAAPRQQLQLAVDGLDLSRLVAMLELEGLAASGRLIGEIPLVLGGDSVVIQNAMLHSTEPGVLRYRPSSPPTGLVGAGESMQLLLKALDDFHYDQLTMTLNGRAGGDLVATMKITGANPDLYGGYPIEFNLNVSGKLGTILDEAVSSYQIPDRIRERMSDFGTR